MKNGWKTEPLGELCDIRNGSTPSKGNPAFWDGGTIPWFTIDDMREQGREIAFTRQKITNSALSETSVKLLPEDSVLLCCTASVGEFAITRIPLTTNQQFNGLVVKNRNQLDPNFLFHYASTLKDELLGLSGKTTIDFIPISRLRDVAVPVPPLAEQQRIVGLLDEAFEGLATAKANAEKNLQNARALFESVLTTAMSGKLTKEWRKSHPHVETGSALLDQILAKRRRAWSKKGEYPEPTPSSKNDSQSIPASWTWTNLSQLKTFSLYGPRFSNDDYSQTGVLVLRTSDIDENGKVNSDTAPKLKMTEAEFDKYRCKKGDLLITRTGSLGTLAVFDDDTRAIPGAYLIQFRLGFSEVIPWFLFAFFKSPAAQARLTSGGTGAGIQNLNVPTLEAIPLPFPPIDEQREIVSQLNTLAEETQRLARIYERKLSALAELKKSLLHQAFTGEL